MLKESSIGLYINGQLMLKLAQLCTSQTRVFCCYVQSKISADNNTGVILHLSSEWENIQCDNMFLRVKHRACIVVS